MTIRITRGESDEENAAQEEEANVNETPQSQPQSQEQDLPSQQNDYWIVTENTVQRVHQVPRQKAYTPIEYDDDNPDAFPTPLKYIDVLRTTRGKIGSTTLKDFHDVWTYDKDQFLYEDWWTGTTIFNIIRPRPKPGFIWQNGSELRVQKTEQPEWIHTTEWNKQKEKRPDWSAEWQPFIPLLKECRQDRVFGKDINNMFFRLSTYQNTKHIWMTN